MGFRTKGLTWHCDLLALWLLALSLGFLIFTLGEVPTSRTRSLAEECVLTSSSLLSECEILPSLRDSESDFMFWK